MSRRPRQPMGEKWIDISMALSPDMTLWPGNDAPTLRHTREFEDGFRSISSVFTGNLHNGTHIDAPLHFMPNGETVDQLPIEPFIGPAIVIDATGVAAITAEVLAERVAPGTERVLLRTESSLRRLAGRREFDPAFIGLTVDASRWLVEHGVRLVGNDYPSIAVYKGESEIHLALMRAGIGILEGIVLDHVEPGNYELVCLPILIKDAEGSPVRAVLRKIGGQFIDRSYVTIEHAETETK